MRWKNTAETQLSPINVRRHEPPQEFMHGASLPKSPLVHAKLSNAFKCKISVEHLQTGKHVHRRKIQKKNHQLGWNRSAN